MPEDPSGIRDDSNPYRRLRPDEATDDQRLRSARRIAIGSLVMTLLWGLGFLSLGGALGGAATLVHLRGHDEPLTRRIAQAAVVLGSIGFIATLIVAGPGLFEGSTSGP